MPQSTYLPREVVDSIRKHLDRAVEESRATFESAAEDEDTMTGHLGAHIKHPPERVLVDGTTWSWSITYRKLRGRGPAAAEKLTGADGIFDLVVDRGGSQSVRKSALFQAKMFGEGGRHLLEQAVKLSTWREAAFIMDYSPERFTALTISAVLAAQGRSIPITQRTDLATFIVDEFISCNIGDRDLTYDGSSKRLYWRDIDAKYVTVPFVVRHRLKVDVKSPWYRSKTTPHVDRILKPEEIHAHRMWATPEDILGVPPDATTRQLNAAKRQAALQLHPDRFSTFDEQIREAANKRMAEANAAYDSLRKHHGR